MCVVSVTLTSIASCQAICALTFQLKAVTQRVSMQYPQPLGDQLVNDVALGQKKKKISTVQ